MVINLFFLFHIVLLNTSCSSSDAGVLSDDGINTETAISILRQSPTITGNDFDPITYLEVVNALKIMGQDKAVRILSTCSQNINDDKDNERIILVCRTLFKPAEGNVFRRPLLGKPDIPWDIYDPLIWPRLPLAIENQIPFLIVSGYLLGGLPESAQLYLEYCLKELEWDSDVIPLPDIKQITSAVNSLISSKRWQAMFGNQQSKVLYVDEQVKRAKQKIQNQ